MTDTTGRGYATDLFPTDPDARYAHTELETSAERAARVSRTMTDRQVITVHDHIKIMAVQAEHYARYADETARTIARAEIARSRAETQATEDLRANRRNRNRTYTLIVALMFTFLVPYIVANILHDASLLKYATGIAIIPDALITLWAYVRKY